MFIWGTISELPNVEYGDTFIFDDKNWHLGQSGVIKKDSYTIKIHLTQDLADTDDGGFFD